MKTYGIKKTIIRCTVKLPDNTARIQRLYDYGAWFQLDEEQLFNADKNFFNLFFAGIFASLGK